MFIFVLLSQNGGRTEIVNHSSLPFSNPQRNATQHSTINFRMVLLYTNKLTVRYNIWFTFHFSYLEHTHFSFLFFQFFVTNTKTISIFSFFSSLFLSNDTYNSSVIRWCMISPAHTHTSAMFLCCCCCYRSIFISDLPWPHWLVPPPLGYRHWLI